MDQPPRFKHSQYPHHFFQLQKSLYGLKQAPLEWYKTLAGQLIKLGFQDSKMDTSLYYTLSVPLFLLIYVDAISSFAHLSPKYITSSPLSQPISNSNHLAKHPAFLALNFTNIGMASCLHRPSIKFPFCAPWKWNTVNHFLRQVLQHSNNLYQDH